jgi:hypothetical protein
VRENIASNAETGFDQTVNGIELGAEGDDFSAMSPEEMEKEFMAQMAEAMGEIPRFFSIPKTNSSSSGGSSNSTDDRISGGAQNTFKRSSSSGGSMIRATSSVCVLVVASEECISTYMYNSVFLSAVCKCMLSKESSMEQAPNRQAGIQHHRNRTSTPYLRGNKVTWLLQNDREQQGERTHSKLNNKPCYPFFPKPLFKKSKSSQVLACHPCLYIFSRPQSFWQTARPYIHKKTLDCFHLQRIQTSNI